jgi:steroid delta-isomerase-like uncharacterized protein
MSVEKNKQLSRRLFEEFWNKHNSNFAPEMFTSDYTVTDPFVGSPADIAASKNYFESIVRAFPDLKWKIDDQVAEGDMVVTRLSATGTHEGEFLGIAGTHRKATVPMFVMHTFRDGKIAKSFQLWDVFGFLLASGAFTPPAGMTKPAFAMR